jgi:hypothetical protein
MRREAAEIVGDELVEVARHSGQHVRAIGRTSHGSIVAAVVAGEAKPAGADVERELETLRRAFGQHPIVLTYRVTGSAEHPIEVARALPKGSD